DRVPRRHLPACRGHTRERATAPVRRGGPSFLPAHALGTRRAPVRRREAREGETRAEPDGEHGSSCAREEAGLLCSSAGDCRESRCLGVVSYGFIGDEVGMLKMAILGFLRDFPLHAYDLKNRVAALAGHVRPIADGTLSPTIKKLEEAGCLTRRTAPGSVAAP